MNKALKWFGGLIGLLVVLVGGGAAAVLFLVDPNDYKGEISAAVEKQTGRKLEMGGDIGLTLYPSFALELDRVALANAPGFGDAPFAKVERAELRVEVMPLLENRVEMDTLVLHGLELNLLRRADGSTNWDDLAKSKSADEKEKAGMAHGKGGEAAAIALGGIDLRDATVRWRDEQAGVAYALEGVAFTSSAVMPGRPIDLGLSGNFSSEQPKLAGRLEAGGKITWADLKAQTYKVGGLDLALSVEGEGVPGGRAELSLAADLELDGQRRKIDLTALELVAMGLPLRGELHGAGESLSGKLESGAFDPRPLLAAVGASLPEGASLDSASLAAEFTASPTAAELTSFNFSLGELKGEGALKLDDFAAPRYSGKFQAGFVDLRKLLPALGVALPETSDPNTLTKFGVRTTFEGTKSGVKLPKFELALDESYLQGGVQLTKFSPLASAFDLKLNQIDVDRYLPPPPPESAAGEAPAAAAPAGPSVGLPLDTLRALNLSGKLTIDKLKVKGMSADAVTLELKARDGVVDMKPAAKLYQGAYRGEMQLDARGEVPRFRAKKSLQGIRIGHLLRDLTGKPERIDGHGNVSFDLKGAGMDEAAIKRSLNGSGRVALNNGAVKGVNVVQMLREAEARYKGRPVPPAGTNQTDFSELGATFQVAKGVVTNRDFSAKSPLLRILGGGTVDLPQGRLDYGVKVSVVGTLKGQGGAELKDLAGITVPLRAKGPFDDLSYKLDVGAVVKEKAKEEIKKKVQDELGGKLQDALGGKLKGLFGR